MSCRTNVVLSCVCVLAMVHASLGQGRPAVYSRRDQPKRFAGKPEPSAGTGCGTIISSMPPTGAIDARQPHAIDDPDSVMGWDEVVIEFAGQAAQTYSAEPDMAIPDGDDAGLLDTINVPDNATIMDLDVEIDIMHSWVGDVVVTLTHGDTTITLVDRPGEPETDFGSQRNGIDVILDDEGTGGSIEAIPVNDGPAVTSPPSYTPSEALSAFDGMDAAGEWTLKVSDHVDADDGRLMRWGLRIAFSEPPEPQPADFTVTQVGVAGAPPAIMDVIALDDSHYRLVLDRVITPGARTTITHDCSGTHVELAHLPGNVNGDCSSSAADVLTLIEDFEGTLDPPLKAWQCDINHSELCEPSDILRTIDLLNGANSFLSWSDVALPCPEIRFTIGQDDLSGSINNDLFSAPLAFNPEDGMQYPTLQTGDMAVGLAGFDTLEASFVRADNPSPQLAGLEDIRLSHFGATPAGAGTSSAASLLTFDAFNVSGVEEYASVNSTDDITLARVPALIDIGMTGINNTAIDMAMEFADSSVTAGLDDEIEFSFGVRMGAAVFVTPAGEDNGLETLEIVSEGDGINMNTIETVLHVQNDDTPNSYLDNAAATSLTTCRFSGSSALNSKLLPDSVVEFDGASMGADWTLGAGDGSASDPYVAFHETDQDITSITGGNGDDLFVFGAQLTSSDASGATEFIDGGFGIDGVQATLDADLAAVVPLLSIEELYLNAINANRSINLTGVGGLEAVIIDGAIGAVQDEQLTLLNISGSPLPGVTFRGDGGENRQGYDRVNYAATGVGGSGDVLEIFVHNRGIPLNAAGDMNVHAVGAFTANNIERLTLDVQDGPATFSSLSGSTLSAMTALASSHLVLESVGTGGAAATIVSLNFAGVGGNLTATINDCANGVSLTGGLGDDHVTMSNSAALASAVINLGAGNDTFVSLDADSQDVISTGAGNDTITPGGGNDVVTPGPGEDVVVFISIFASVGMNLDGMDQISGFGVGDSLRFGITPLPLTTGVKGQDNMTVIGNNGADTTVIIDLNTDATTNFLTITLTGVTLTADNFEIHNTTDIVRIK